MILQSEFPVTGFQFLLARAARDAQHFVIIAFCHGHFTRVKLQGFTATRTIAGRNSLPLKKYPRWNSPSTAWSSASLVSTLSTAWCRWGSKFLPAVSIGFQTLLLQGFRTAGYKSSTTPLAYSGLARLRLFRARSKSSSTGRSSFTSSMPAYCEKSDFSRSDRLRKLSNSA